MDQAEYPGVLPVFPASLVHGANGTSIPYVRQEYTNRPFYILSLNQYPHISEEFQRTY